jgi:hypothetical protein
MTCQGLTKQTGSAEGKFERGQQKYVFPLPFIDPICEIAVEWHLLLMIFKDTTVFI